MSNRTIFSERTFLSCITIISHGLAFCTALCLSAPAWADSESDMRQKLFEMDKVSAIAGFDANQQHACLQAFNARYASRYRVKDALAFNEPLSQGAYDRLFWKGEGSVHRGLIFTGVATDTAGVKAGNVVCYYATTDDHLDFQSAYMLPGKEMTVAANGAQILASLYSKE